MSNSTRYALDLSIQHFQQRHGDLTIIGSWFGEESREPCLVLVKTNAILSHERITPCIVRLSNAWAWAEETGDLQQVIKLCMGFADALGLDRFNQMTIMRIASIIRDHMGDLLSMPPAPEHDKRVVADLFYTNTETGKVIHKEVKDRD